MPFDETDPQEDAVENFSMNEEEEDEEDPEKHGFHIDDEFGGPIAEL